jgi:hypothetical protein
MYYYYWEPKQTDGVEAAPLFSGRIKLSAPKYQERLAYFKELSKFGDLTSKEMNERGIEKINAMIDIARKHIQEIDLKRIDDGFEIKDLDAMEYDQDCSQLLLQVASSILEGGKLGKSLMKN